MSIVERVKTQRYIQYSGEPSKYFLELPVAEVSEIARPFDFLSLPPSLTQSQTQNTASLFHLDHANIHPNLKQRQFIIEGDLL